MGSTGDGHTSSRKVGGEFFQPEENFFRGVQVGGGFRVGRGEEEGRA